MLRKYQSDAVSKMQWALTLGGNNIVNLPVGSGKTHVISGFVEATQLPVLILAPSKELILQDKEKLEMVVDPSEVGVYSASVGIKEVKKYTLATIGSIYKKPELFRHYKVVIIDECHLVAIDKKNTMYMKFLSKMGNPTVIGLTATMFRQAVTFERPGGWDGYKASYWDKKNLEAVTTTKMLTRFKSRFWHRVLCATSTHELQMQGFLSHIKYTDLTLVRHEDIPTNKSASDFDLDAYEELIDGKEQTIVDHIIDFKDKHKKILVFCSSVAQAKRLSGVISGSEYVDGTMGKKERDRVVNGFKKMGGTQVVFNVGVLTTGFDLPQLDCVVLIRPTKSLGLYNQMLGRLTRKAEGKTFGYVYDFSGTVASLGRMESIKAQKVGGLWDVVSETKPRGFHNVALYKHTLGGGNGKRKKTKSYEFSSTSGQKLW